MREPNAVDNFITLNKHGVFEPVWWKRDVIPFWLYPDTQIVNGYTTINAFGSAQTPDVVYKLPHASNGMDSGLGNPLCIRMLAYALKNVDISQISGLANGFTVMMKDMGDQTQFMNAPIHILTFAGTGQLPARLSEPLFLPTRHNLILQLAATANVNSPLNASIFPIGDLYCTWSTNLANKPNNYQAMISLVMKYLERRKYIFPYWLTTDFGGLNVPANQYVEQDATVSSDGHFEATHITAASTGAFQVEFFNPETRQTLMNGTIHSSMLGNALNPQPFPCSWVVPAGNTVRFRVTDLSGSANNVFITLRGCKIRAPLKSINEIKKDTEVAA